MSGLRGRSRGHLVSHNGASAGGGPCLYIFRAVTKYSLLALPSICHSAGPDSSEYGALKTGQLYLL